MVASGDGELGRRGLCEVVHTRRAGAGRGEERAINRKPGPEQ